jgi:hypothetical protein
LLDIGDGLIVFRDQDSDGNVDMRSTDGFSPWYKGQYIGTGHIGPYTSEYDSNYFFHDFKITPFSNVSSIDGRSTRGWSIKIPSIDPNRFQGTALGATPRLKDVQLWVDGVTYNGTTGAGPFPVANINATDACDDGANDVYVFMYSKFNQMVFDDNGALKNVSPSTVCSLKEKNLRSLTGAVFVYIDTDQSDSFTANDVVYVYEPIDDNGHEDANWVSMGFSNQGGIFLNLEDW